jgi:hypothetical protein
MSLQLELLIDSAVATSPLVCANASKSRGAKTQEPGQIDDVTPLRTFVRHSDHELKQVWRDQTHAVYKHFGAYGQFIGWEAIKIKRAKARIIFGKSYPEREVYPGPEDFGRYALSVGAQYDLEHAKAKAKTL